MDFIVHSFPLAKTVHQSAKQISNILLLKTGPGLQGADLPQRVLRVGKQGRKRSLLTDAAGIPLYLVAAGANCPDSTLLRQTLTGLPHLGNRPRPLPVLLDRGYLVAPVQAGFRAPYFRLYGKSDVVMRALAKAHRLPYVDVAAIDVPQSIVDRLPESVARENSIFPIEQEGDSLRIATSDPTDLDIQEKLRFILNSNVDLSVAPRDQIVEAIEQKGTILEQNFSTRLG